jgi:hypothetical protein
MGGMRAMFVLLTILSFATPGVSFAARDLQPTAACSMSLATPAPGSQMVRPAVKTDKTFSTTGAIALEWVSVFPPFGSIDYVSAQTCDAPHLDLEGPPLAPRPPPLS